MKKKKTKRKVKDRNLVIERAKVSRMKRIVRQSIYLGLSDGTDCEMGPEEFYQRLVDHCVDNRSEKYSPTNV